MAQSPAHWRVIQHATNDEVSTLLIQDPVWNCFALADLEPPLRTYSQFALAYQDESKARATCLILRHPIIGQVLSPSGSAEGIAALLRQIALPENPLLQVQEHHIPVLQQFYRPESPWKSLLRMAITDDALRPPTYEPPQAVRQLGVEDIPALLELYAQQSEVAFSAELFTQGVYFGAYEGERIVAAGGTHALTSAHHIAVLGHILTAPEARRQGYATAITSALVTALLRQGFSTIVLNVVEDNHAAYSVYQRLGFQTHHRLITGKATLLR